MAKATVRIGGSSSESEHEYPKSAKKSAAATKNESAEDEAGDDDDEDEDEEEYEIEAILEAKHGVFPNGRTGYLVKWKGYDEDHNSWVDEKDAEGAKELIDKFWQRQSHKKNGPRKSETKSKTTAKPRKSAAAKDKDEDEDTEDTTQAKKRGRQPKAREPPSDGMDEDEDEAPKKKPRKSAGGKGTKRAPKDDEDDEEIYTNMKKWKDAASWEHLVEQIDTVERSDDGKLYVYFTLKHNRGHGKETTDVCKQKMPLMLLDFYESNLRWKPTDENAMEE